MKRRRQTKHMPIRVMQHRLPLAPGLVGGLLDNGCPGGDRSDRHRIDVVHPEADCDARVSWCRRSLVQLEFDPIVGDEHCHSGQFVLEGEA